MYGIERWESERAPPFSKDIGIVWLELSILVGFQGKLKCLSIIEQCRDQVASHQAQGPRIRINTIRFLAPPSAV